MIDENLALRRSALARRVPRARRQLHWCYEAMEAACANVYSANAIFFRFMSFHRNISRVFST